MGGKTSNKVKNVFAPCHKTALSALLAISRFPRTTHVLVKFRQNPPIYFQNLHSARKHLQVPTCYQQAYRFTKLAGDPTRCATRSQQTDSEGNERVAGNGQ